ncbi:N-6 DNA methylase [Fusobacterium perfoetens]|uniref:Eco57I restriction-modification methylase domain-containing protein n=1 Tax=Fusobacterium perfoetens TaxID=852 RepID=UPI0026E9F267|nr:N-6 DNA methylase [Fusobacterium perfoetens]
MNIENKQRIIDNLFDNKFNLDNFKEFVANILNVKIANRAESKSIFKAFFSYITSYQVISEYLDEEKNKIYVMVVKVKEDKDPIRARVKQREFIAKLLREWHKDGALVVFYNEDSLHWRMSFIRLNYEFTMKGIEEKITPAKRLSYVVGEGEACKTAKDQFYTLANLEESVSLSKLEEVFALEKVTNEFFKEYKNKYLDIKETLINDENFMAEAKKHDSEKPESFAEGFAKKLMGQISFIYFLQKKGWLGLKMTADKLSYEEYNKIYERALDKEKEVLEKVYDRVDRDTFVLNKEELSKLDNKTESELLARAFNLPKYFKEWGNGDKKFLRTLFDNHSKNDKDNGKTFFEDYLEVLFYNNFSEDRGELQYSTEFDSRIPFLNGGLFDPYGDYKWRETKFNLKDELFSNDDETGILDIFDRYNFTINENDSYETEVAVDPEMLGKVFENLLDVSDRKSKGAFYTPREIVRYMTNESIMNYLLTNLEGKDITKNDLEYLFSLGEFTKEYDQQIFEKDYLSDNKPLEKDIFGMPRNIITNSKMIDELLIKVKIADPACGSGAFPLGILNEIVRARNVLTFYINMIEVLKEKDEKNYWKRIDKKQKERKLYKLKLETIQNCLYGVDIEPSAIDITKLRLWLSIIVDSDNNNVRPLPNLDFNFMIGNSLIDEFEGMKLFDESLLNEVEEEGKLEQKQLIKESKLFQSTLFKTDEERKQDILKVIFKKQAEYFNERNSEKKKELKREIESLENQLIRITLILNGNEKKLEEIEKGRKERRKPYFLWKLEFAKVFRENGGFDIVIGNPPYVNIYSIKQDEKKFYLKKYKSAKKKYDLYILFMELALNLLKMNGTSSLITSNKWLSQAYGEGIRNIYLENDIKKIINFKFDIFKSAKVSTSISVLNKKNNKDENKKFEVLEIDFDGNNYLLDKKTYSSLEEILTKNNFSKLSYKMINQSEEKNFRINLTDKKIKLIEKIKSQSIRLDEICYINYGLRGNSEKLNVGKDYFIKSTNEEEKYKSYFEGKDIVKWKFNSNLFFDYQPDLHYNSMFKEIFENEKLVSTEVIGKGSFKIAFDKNKRYNNHTVINILRYELLENVEYKLLKKIINLAKITTSKNYSYEFLLGCLNSKLIFWYFNELLSIDLHFYPNYVKQLPLIILSVNRDNLKKEIEKVVIEILDSEDKKYIEILEEKLNELVYDLYELTEEEKELIRGF